jgi:RES domain-containing protein
VIIPQELNYLINPKHPDFAKLKIEPPTAFAFEQRLWGV